MSTCSFCGNDYSAEKGFTLFKKDGTPLHYCSHKCLRNAELKRKPSKLKWTSK